MDGGNDCSRHFSYQGHVILLAKECTLVYPALSVVNFRKLPLFWPEIAATLGVSFSGKGPIKVKKWNFTPMLPDPLVIHSHSTWHCLAPRMSKSSPLPHSCQCYDDLQSVLTAQLFSAAYPNLS